jgi:uncharacterized membrane protein (UPF0127 family)
MRDTRTFGPGRDWLVCDGRTVAPLVVAETSAARRKGLLGTDRVEGALWITRCPSVHMVGMRYPIDVAVLDRGGMVLRTKTIKPWTGGTFYSRGAVATLEAAAGALATWGIVVGCQLSVDRSDTARS